MDGVFTIFAASSMHAGVRARATAWMFVAVATLWATSTCTVVASPARNVLVLFSNSRLVPGNVEVDRGLRDAFRDAQPLPIHLFSEFLDSPEFGGEAHEQAVIAYLRAKYAGRAPDIMVAFSDASFEFLARHRGAPFPGVPLVYASVSPTVLQRYALPKDVVGVSVEYDFGGTIEQALRWHPNAQRLVIVTGTSSRDRGWEARLRREVPSLAGTRRVEFWAGLPTAALVQQLADLDAHTVVFTPGYYADGSGAMSSPGETIKHIARASAAPVYGPLDTFIGTGVVGGRMPSFEGIGRQAGRIVKQILAGEQTAAPATVAVAPIALHVDWRQVQRFGIKEADIPADAVIHYRAPTFWEQYRLVAIIATSLILLQAGLIAALLLERRRRQTAEVAAQKHRIELAHASRLAVAGELTASIAHEINQPLGAMQASADAADLLLQSDVECRSDLRRIVTRIRRDSVRASDVISRLRSLLARHAPERHPFDLGVAIDEVATMMSAEARRRSVALDVRIDSPLPPVAGDRTQIQQVLINLVLNAMDAVADLETDRRVVEIAVERLDGRIHVAVRDRGKGIAPQDVTKVFDSFYSTKSSGMGLGLSIARTIVEAHEGRIFAESAVDAGATFWFDLPVSPDAAVAQLSTS
ncbi:MAG: ATP-binding protein [Betaproteobacteria bacterium]